MSRRGYTSASSYKVPIKVSTYVHQIKEANKLENQKTPHGCQSFFDLVRKKDHVRRTEAGYTDNDYYFVLLDCDGKKLKFKTFTYREAYRRNESLKGTGFSWSRCDPERPA